MIVFSQLLRDTIFLDGHTHCNDDIALTARALMLHPDGPPSLAAGLLQVTMGRVGHVVGAADGIGSHGTIRGALTQTLAVLNDARRAPGAIGLLAGF